MDEKITTCQCAKSEDKIWIELLRYFIHNLLYPAFLGTFIVSVFDNFHAAKSLNLIIAFALIIFYCCDYLYSHVIKSYKLKFLIFDFIVIVALVFSFYGIDLSAKGDLPNIYRLFLPFVGFLGLFLIWDICCRNKNKNNEPIKFFYLKLIGWEVLILLAYASFFFFYYKNLINRNDLYIVFIISLYLSSAFYFYMALEKAKLFK
ncbi:MAG: hypothetical protein V4541_02900 [Bacteroidota bacterium]